MGDTLFDEMSRRLTRELIISAINRIGGFCPTCDGYLDIGRGVVLLTSPDAAGISCAQCFDSGIGAKYSAEQFGAGRVEVDDSRTLE